MRQQRRIGGDHDDDRALVRWSRRRLARADRSADLCRPGRRRCAARRARRSSPAPARRRCTSSPSMRTTRELVPVPPLNPWQIMPVPPPTLPSATAPPLRAVERREHVLRLHVKAVDVVEIAVPGFGHDRQRPPVAGRIGFALSDAPLDCGVAHHADAVGVGDQHRAFEEAAIPRSSASRSSRRCR